MFPGILTLTSKLLTDHHFDFMAILDPGAAVNLGMAPAKDHDIGGAAGRVNLRTAVILPLPSPHVRKITGSKNN
jgi:hypothetical protein